MKLLVSERQRNWVIAVTATITLLWVVSVPHQLIIEFQLQFKEPYPAREFAQSVFLYWPSIVGILLMIIFCAYRATD